MAERDLRQDACLYIQFARVPEPGKVKTRMQGALGPRGACELHCELLVYTALQLRSVGDQPSELWIGGETSHPWLSRLAAHHGMGLRRQRGVDLGERMLHALRDGLTRYRRVLLVGSDCPGLDPDYLRDAADRLLYHDMVWGPAADGGYVLVGARRAEAACFRGVDWGSPAVLAQTLQRAREHRLSHALLPLRDDIDRPEDLALWRASGGSEIVMEALRSADADGLLAQGLALCACAD